MTSPMAVATAAGRSWGRRWPTPAMQVSWAPGILAASLAAAAGGTMWSVRPVSTAVNNVANGGPELTARAESVSEPADQPALF